ncbi:hypothetical protein RQP46_005394 [Phenoliferia psychrophenolica]
MAFLSFKTLFLLALAITPQASASWLNIAELTGTCTLAASGKDDGPAFALALSSSKCKSVIVPKHVTLSIRSPLNTTRTYNKHIRLEGTLSFLADVLYWNENSFKITYQNSSSFWLLGGQNIKLDGGGVIQGNGQAWYNAFAANSDLYRPIPLTISHGKDVVVQDISVLQSPMWNFLITDSQDVHFDKMYLHSNSTNSSILAKNTDPGEYDIVEDIYVSNVRMSDAQNGIRIKSWAGPNVGSGRVSNIYYDKWQGDDIDYPIIIDTCWKKKSLVVDLACSPGNNTCTNIHLDNITITPPPAYAPATYVCQNTQVQGNAASLFNCTTT